MELDGLLNRPLSEFERFNVMTPQGEQLREDFLGPPSYRSVTVMAINTDAAFEKSGLGEREVSNPTDFQDTEKLLSKAPAEPTGESNLKPSDSFPLNTRSSVRSLNAEQNGRRSPLKSGSFGQLTAPPRSASRLSLGQLSSPVPPGSEPPSYLWLAVVSCFCPGVPFNVCALWYANVSRSVLHTGDIEGARKYGRRSMLLSVLAMLTGVVVIIFVVLTIEAQQ